MQPKKIAILFLLLVLLVGNIVFITKYAASKQQLKNADQAIQARLYNGKVVGFLQLFVEKVLRADTEVNFEDRLQLENAVRDLDDTEIITAWNTFVKSESEADAQKALKDLLGILVSKIKA